MSGSRAARRKDGLDKIPVKRYNQYQSEKAARQHPGRCQEERKGEIPMLCQYPPMGWNSWDCYGTAVTEEIVRQNAQYMADHMKAFGWEYVVVDIQWYAPGAVDHSYHPFSEPVMDDFGRLLPAPNRFPSASGGAGFAPLAAYVHSLGLKFGIHIMRGVPRAAAHRRLPVAGSDYRCDQAADPNDICEWNPDMYGTKSYEPAAKAYYDSIFRLYADWGVDFVKCDDIAREYPRCRHEIELISSAAGECGRDIVLSLSPGPAPLKQAEHLKTWANMWRITDDFWDSWEMLKAMFERAQSWCIHAGPGHWPDADMLPVGAVRLCGEETPAGRWTLFTHEEQKTMLTLWCMMRSPLMIGAELTRNDDFTLRLLTNRDILEIEKESFCAHPLFTTDDLSIWIAPRTDGKGLYAALFNLSDSARTMSIQPSWIERPFTEARELWTDTVTDKLTASLPAHGCAVWLLTE